MTQFDTANVQRIKNVMARGKSVRLVQDYYGRPHAEIRSRWLFWRAERLPLDPQEAVTINSLLAHSKRPRH